ncbi:hypothetical protein GVN16_13855 [Emticicia sp. CRIBPO]|uniref:sensor histidine kinase n=1 Tax=Emticicia sp. CRIBPO TaxID=2683258 RepID=UPI001412D816|nr:7TM diverse intracellular signaling domain-containing protein [Emticicia sp. CRIBPO]NBA86854.1 hypothetical protein [Emticicia sp. CRIBPO]
MTLTLPHLFMISFLSVLLFQCAFSIVQLSIHKRREYFYYTLYLWLLFVNFSVNFYFTLYPIPDWEVNYLRSFFGLPVNYLIYVFYLLFIYEYLQLPDTAPRFAREIIIFVYFNLFISVITGVFFCLYPQWPQGIIIPLLFISFLGILYPILRVWQQRLKLYRYVLIGCTVLAVGYLCSFMLSISNGYMGTSYDTDFPTYIGVLVEIFYFNYALQYKTNWLEKQILLKEIENQKNIEEEHRRLSADLHDEVGSTLSSIQIMSVLSEKQLQKNPKEVERLLNLITYQSDKMNHTLSDIVWGLRTDVDKIEDLNARMYEVLTYTLESADIAYSITPLTSGAHKQLTSLQRRSILLAFKEAINNILKYSHAKNVTISLEIVAGQFILTIKDDGVGFEVEQDLWTGNGLRNMQYRMQEIGGACEIISRKTLGTTITYTFPLAG